MSCSVAQHWRVTRWSLLALWNGIADMLGKKLFSHILLRVLCYDLAFTVISKPEDPSVEELGCVCKW